MSSTLGLPTDEIDQWCRILEMGCASLRNPETKNFNAINLKSGEHTGHLTSASFLCWYAGMGDKSMLDLLKNTLPVWEATSYIQSVQKGMTYL